MSGTEAEDARALAGEYVLGVLDEAEMRDIRQRARGDAGLAREIRAWEAQLLPMAAVVAPVAPPPALWDRIAGDIAPLAAEPANDPGSPPAARRASRAWPIATGLSLALAAGLAAFALLPVLRTAPPEGSPKAPPLVASLAPVNAPAPAFVAATRADGSVQLAAVSPPGVPAGRDLELWILRPGETRVAPLGTFAANGALVRLPSAAAVGTQLFISLEPAGGSKTGQPTGPVLFSGTLTSL